MTGSVPMAIHGHCSNQSKGLLQYLEVSEHTACHMMTNF